MSKYDLVVIGSGPSGRRAAIQAAKLGQSVLVIENRLKVGGVSIHTGTIPSKTLRETVLNLSGWRERGFYGRAYRVKKEIDGQDLGARMRMTLNYEIDVLEHQFARNGVKTLAGEASFFDTHQIAVATGNGETVLVDAEKIIIAVGTTPYRPKHIPFNDHCVVDSDSLIKDLRVPRSLIVVGAGVIGIEYATIYSALDVPVTLVEPRETILDFVDREIVDELIGELRRRGVRIRLGASVERIEVDEDNHAAALMSDGRLIKADMLLYTAGRVGATASLNLHKCGLEVDPRGRLSVDAKTFQTSVPHIYATGDVIGFPSLASTSMEQGRIAACHAFGAPSHHAPEFFPYGIYAVPEISSVGLSEDEARAKNISYECGIARFRETSRGNIMGLEAGMMKLIFDLKNRRLLGVHIIGEGATELIHIGQAVLNLKGTLDYFVENTFNYPTLAEAYKIAALDAYNRMPKASVKKKRKAA